MRARLPFIVASVLAVVGLCALVWFRAYAPAARMLPASSGTGTVPSAVATPTDAANVNGSAGLPLASATARIAPLGEPLTDALSRVTKKGFGLYVTPKNSPVQPERFTGYHTGVDFEMTPAEQAVDVPVSAVCDGPLARKETASGYGGVVVQRCTLGGRDVTVIYGHLRITSVTAKIGSVLKRGDRIGVLGTGFSAETDGERKHLHLGIHLGTAITIKGYVRTKAELSGWLDAREYLVP